MPSNPHHYIVAVGALELNGRILIDRRIMPQHPMLHDKWELPGGKVEYGEHPADTVMRELYEELDVRTYIVGDALPMVVNSAYTNGDPIDDFCSVIVGYLCRPINAWTIDDLRASSKTHSTVAWAHSQTLPLDEDSLPGTNDWIRLALAQAYRNDVRATKPPIRMPSRHPESAEP